MTTDTDTGLAPVAVIARYDVHPHAFEVTADNLLAVAAHLGLNVTGQHTLSPVGAIEIPFERRYNLASTATPGDVIVRHPNTVRELEVLSAKRYAEQYTPADGALLDALVREEFPDAHAWAIIASGPAGVYAVPGQGIVDAAHLIGIAELVSRAGRARP